MTGDIPYAGKEDLFQDFVDSHNRKSPAKLFFHDGDIKSQTDACPESHYALTYDIMTQLAVPSFIVPGDNEWNDCADPAAAWAFWEEWFTDFHENFCGAPVVEAQPVRHENWAFVRDGVLFVGLNLVGGSAVSAAEKDRRLQDDADWVETQSRARPRRCARR